jgi:hypothetical protein
MNARPGLRVGPRGVAGKNLHFPDAPCLLAGEKASPMGLARCLESGLDRGRPLLRIGAEEYVRVLEVSGAGHGGVEEGRRQSGAPPR